MSKPPRQRSGRRTALRECHRWGERPGERGQSTTLDYTLALAVAAVVATVLFAAAGNFVADQRERVVRTELGVIGQQLADEVVAADRLARAGDDTETLVVNATMPQQVAGTSYTVTVAEGGGTHWLNLSSDRPEVSVTTQIRTETDVATGSLKGGSVDIVYDPAADRLEVRG